MAADPKPLTRDQLAKFLTDQEAIKRFERLFAVAGDLTPADVATLYRLTQEASIDAGIADLKAVQALDSLTRIAEALEFLSLQPAQVVPPVEDILAGVLPSLFIDELADVSSTIPSAGNVLIYNATLRKYVNALLSAGTNVAITNADGSITIAVSSAAPSGAASGVLSGTYPNPGFAVDMATQAELDAAIATREPTIAAGTTAQYWRGDKSWQDFASAVRASVLTGLSTATNAVITAADTVLSALGKLQKQISDNLTTLATHTGGTAEHGATGAVVGTTNVQTLFSKTLSAPGVTGIMNLAGGQILFPATQVPSADPNTLDDYEEGTWTPTVTSSSGTITSYTLVGANYTKIGRAVNVNVAVTITNAGTGAGALNITLPFTNGAVVACGSGRENALTGFQIQASVIASSNTMSAYNYANSTVIATSAQIRISMTYFV